MKKDSYLEACRTLDLFVTDQAKKMARDLGFGWTAKPDAPDTYDKLKREYCRSSVTGADMPVSSLFCNNVVYSSDSINHAMRFWHDSLHVQTRLTFALDDELELGLHHLKLAERQGIKKGTTAWQILRVDLLGQNYLLGVAKRFPLNQAQFIKDCITTGLDDGVLREARRAA